ncbi:aspartate carbamoyltransferase catalytic subunit [Thalassobaculum sp. OXR-137]|uniref:aspartate carbamoyltransferase catalytic subunit n=1 Tax=Thalassobaculum sp. OXR-137 TaxID=3100173 RepID=UPI002AC8FAE5|nr:aspartate carbamoyltransferase catalytic subunit [Thalassobaculum sp. OXR-137]WPZ33583.1 aspartate carbamoyltransferase catalytic subunit [Thalassobaculum sp. OXR-137]
MTDALSQLATPASDDDGRAYPHRHLLGIEGLTRPDIDYLLDRSERFVDQNRQLDKKGSSLRGRTVINLFFENSTRTRTSFELAGKRLGGDVINMSVGTSSIKKGESLIDTAMTLNAMHPDALVVRHSESGAVQLLSEKVNCSVINAGDGSHEHPTQALLDALTIRRRKGRLEGLEVAICGDVAHSRVARSNIHLLSIMGARVRLVAPPTLLPSGIERMGVEIHHDMERGIAGCDIVMMLRLQTERMRGSFVPSVREYFRYFGLDVDKLQAAKPDALIMHPGPMNRGVEIDSLVADDIDRSLIREQVEMGVAVRMAILDILVTNQTEPWAKNQ